MVESHTMDNNNKPNVSVAIITLNEEQNIRRCLESVSWSDDIIVVDSYSEDATVNIARQFTDKVFLRNSTGFADQRNFAASKCSNKWILAIDADEMVTEELRDEIIEVTTKQDFDAYCIPIANKIVGGWLRYGSWYPAYRSRLYSSDSGRWDGTVHEKIMIKGPYGYLQNPIIHFRNKRIYDYISKTNRYTEIDASATSKAPGFLFARIIFQPAYIFFKNYFVQGCLLDGTRGLIVSTLRAYYEFVYYAKIWEKLYSGDESFKGGNFKETTRLKLIRFALNLKRRIH